MAEGWLFRLETSLGARHAAPAWPVADGLASSSGESVVLRRPPFPDRTAPCSEPEPVPPDPPALPPA